MACPLAQADPANRGSTNRFSLCLVSRRSVGWACAKPSNVSARSWSPANYSVVLTLKPTANVTITIAGDSQANASPTRLVFTLANWNTPQSVAVRGMADGLVEGPHIGVITRHAVSGDAKYNGIYISSVTVNIADRRFLYLPWVLR